MSYSNKPAPAAGTVLPFDQISGVDFPRGKLVHGEEGVAVDVSAANPLPVDVADLPLPVGAATEDAVRDVIDTLIARLSTLGAKAAAGSMSVTPSTGGFAVAAPALEAGRARAVVPSAAALATPARALYIGGAGNVTVTSGGENVTFNGVPAGSILPVSATHVLGATTATNIVALI